MGEIGDEVDVLSKGKKGGKRGRKGRKEKKKERWKEESGESILEERENGRK